MNQFTVLAIVALVASCILLLNSIARLPAIIALVASGVEVLMGLGILRLAVEGVPIRLILGGAIAVAGVLVFLRVGTKTAVAASTCLALVGGLQVLEALRVLR